MLASRRTLPPGLPTFPLVHRGARESLLQLPLLTFYGSCESKSQVGILRDPGQREEGRREGGWLSGGSLSPLLPLPARLQQPLTLPLKAGALNSERRKAEGRS